MKRTGFAFTRNYERAAARTATVALLALGLAACSSAEKPDGEAVSPGSHVSVSSDVSGAAAPSGSSTGGCREAIDLFTFPLVGKDGLNTQVAELTDDKGGDQCAAIVDRSTEQVIGKVIKGANITMRCTDLGSGDDPGYIKITEQDTNADATGMVAISHNVAARLDEVFAPPMGPLQPCSPSDIMRGGIAPHTPAPTPSLTWY